VDLDTIDLSNLNRQFLFRKHHIKKSKAHVARESALKFNPNVNIKSHHANIKDPEFSVEWFKSFDIVMNALDNLEARFHVNEMCMAANIPLLESGTEGYVGQVTVIKKDESECYACQEKPKKITYPVCTIRSTPSKPIHCIVWAKSYLFSQLFGTPDDEEEEIKEDMDADNAQEIENLKRETQELIKIREAIGSDNYPYLVFKKVFTDDINRLLTWEDVWKKRAPPKPLVYETLENGVIDNGTGQYSSNSGTLEDQRVWSLKENFNVFVDSVRRLSKRALKEKAEDPTASLSFDKDDDDALDFVTATANLRSYIFDIKMNSKFDVKAMAGNIIPAIATTNAIIAGNDCDASF
ncbi:1051_t:CDS:2, partial [Paraglomus brasilianum]